MARRLPGHRPVDCQAGSRGVDAVCTAGTGSSSHMEMPGELEPVTGSTPGIGTLVDLLSWRARHQPDRLGYRFLLDGESREVSLTYGDLDLRARAIGATLQSRRATGERALLIYPPGLEAICAFFGCLYAGTIAIVLQAPHPARLPQFMSRIGGIASDAMSSVALTTSPILTLLEPSFSPASDLCAVQWLVTDAVPVERAPEWRDPGVIRDDLAFLQYTTGSSTEPRGVMVSHGNLMHNLWGLQDVYGQSPDRHIVSWLPPYHDMGLVGGILEPLYLGSPVTLMSTVAFVQRPRRWLEAISRLKGTASGGPNFAYDLCVRKITEEQRASVDLSSWEAAFNGAEPVHFATLRAFAEFFEPCGFRAEAFTHCYGLAESTLLVSAGSPRIQGFRQSELERNRVAPCAGDEAGANTLVSCAQPAQKTVIVNPDSLTQCPPNQVGEIWVSGPSVARGYWNHPRKTEHTFGACLADTGEGPFLRTGDLGFLYDGDLFITGRLKDLIIIDGNNHYPQDVERTVGECHVALEPTDCVAFSVDTAGRENLVVVAGVRTASALDSEDVRRAIRTSIAEEHDLRLHDLVLVKRGRVPKTASGKVRRRECKSAYLAGTLDGQEVR